MNCPLWLAPWRAAVTIRKFNEALDFGRFSNRVCYASDPEDLPEPITGAVWQEDTSFREDEAVASDPGIARIMDHARQEGFAIVYRPM
jgi:hypothetical protein